MGAITRRGFAGVAALLAAPRIVRADFSQETSRIMVGFSAGGTVDTVARIVAQAVGPILGSFLITPLSELLRSNLGNAAAGLHLVIYSAGLIVIMLYFPSGIAGALERGGGDHGLRAFYRPQNRRGDGTGRR